MNITLNFLGLIKEHIGEESATFTFNNNKANFGDLMAEIHRRYQERLPAVLWDAQHQEFKPGILCVGEGRDLESKETPLKDGETITIAVHMAGG